MSDKPDFNTKGDQGFKVPEGYFDNLSDRIMAQTVDKVEEPPSNVLSIFKFQERP